MNEEVRKLAAEFKSFLSSREEDELIPAASSQAAASFPSEKTAPQTTAAAQETPAVRRASARYEQGGFPRPRERAREVRLRAGII